MKITLVPIAGLCNRINAITSGIAYVEKNKEYNLQIYWQKTFDCHALFSDLFKPIHGYDIKPLDKFYLKPGKKRNLFLPNIFKNRYFDKCIYSSAERFKFPEFIEGKKYIYVSAYNEFTPFEITYSLGKIFVPIDELQLKINEITKLFTNNTIGIHIRRTDNTYAIKNNPIDKFFKLMDKEIILDDEIFFYLATDSEEVKGEMKRKYGNRIITMPASLNRNTIQGMQDAVVDLYCLGSTRKIIGCSHSTYSVMASQLFDIELVI